MRRQSTIERPGDDEKRCFCTIDIAAPLLIVVVDPFTLAEGAEHGIIKSLRPFQVAGADYYMTEHRILVC